MASKASEGYGSILSRGTFTATAASSEAFTAVAEVRNIDGPAGTGKSIDVSNMDSPNGFMEFVPGMWDDGKISVDLNMLQTEATNFIADKRTKRSWRITFPAAVGTTTNLPAMYNYGFIDEFSIGAPHDDRISMKVGIKLTGKGTFTPG